jgi:DNA polymerase-3 subunit alpha
VNRATIEALIKCGAFDALGANRAAMVAAVDHAIEMGQSAAAERKSGQMNFFGGGMTLPQGDSAPRFPDVEPWSEAQLLKAEKETLGFYITSHPLVRYGRELTMLSTPPRVSLADIGRCAGRISIGCMIAAVRPMVTKNGRSAGKKMAMLTLEDLTGKCDAVVFSESYEQFANMIQPEAMVFIAGSVDTRRERPSIVVDEVLPMDSAIEMLTASLTLRLGRVGGALPDIGNGAAYSQSAMLLRLQEILLKHRGQSAILLELSPSTRADVKATIRPDKQWFVKPSRRLIDELIGLLGEENIILTPRPANTDAPKNRYTNRPWSKPNGNGNGGSNAKGPASAAVTRFN